MAIDFKRNAKVVSNVTLILGTKDVSIPMIVDSIFPTIIAIASVECTVHELQSLLGVIESMHHWTYELIKSAQMK